MQKTSDNTIHPAALPTERLLAACDVGRTRRSGPGGQHRNKVETAVLITHRPSGVGAEANESRSQARNKRKAIFRLRINLALDVRSSRKAAPQYAPSELWRLRCRRGRIAVNPSHDDFPALLAEALDVLAAHEMDVKAAADVLGCSATQLVKMLKHERRALAQVNRYREQIDLQPLR